MEERKREEGKEEKIKDIERVDWQKLSFTHRLDFELISEGEEAAAKKSLC